MRPVLTYLRREALVAIRQFFMPWKAFRVGGGLMSHPLARFAAEFTLELLVLLLALSFVSPHGRERLPSAVVLEASLP
jgi:hypothetical protein